MDGSDEGERDEGIGITRVIRFSVLKGMMVVGGVYVREKLVKDKKGHHGRTHKQTNEKQGKIELLSQWMLEG